MKRQNDKDRIGFLLGHRRERERRGVMLGPSLERLKAPENFAVVAPAPFASPGKLDADQVKAPLAIEAVHVFDIT